MLAPLLFLGVLQQAIAPATVPSRPMALDVPPLFTRFEVRVQPEAVYTKIHLKNGGQGIAGSDLTAKETGTLAWQPGGRLALGTTGRDPWLGGVASLTLELGAAAVRGSADFAAGRSWDGSVIHRLHTSADVYSVALDLRQHFELSESLELKVGGVLRDIAFHGDADTDIGPSKLSFNVLFLAPRLTLTARLADWLDLDMGACGFARLRIPANSDDIGDQQTLFAALRVRRSRWLAEVGYRLDEVDMIDHRATADEDFVHIRLRSVYVSFGLRF